MKLIGKPIFETEADGSLSSRIGTIFFRTPGLVTKRGVHAMQRAMWIEALNADRAANGLDALTPEEEEAELAESVDLIFTKEYVLIRPDPENMELAFRADAELQKLVSKRRIRFLNTHSAKVRNALRSSGENWRMARQPITPEDVVNMINNSRVAISGAPIYYYNSITGTRYVTAAGCKDLTKLPPDVLREQVKEAQQMMSRRNRLGRVELDIFPVTTPIEIKQKFKAIDVDSMSDEGLVEALNKLDAEWRMTIPEELRDESMENFEWRNAMAETLMAGPNETTASDGELIQGISPEFYRQIEWLPGARIENGELLFDPLWDEFIRTHDPELAEICDFRARNIIFNLSRVFNDLEYINIGRITRSLARNPVAGSRRGHVYIFQCKEVKRPLSQVFILRFQKWGIAEHLDEGKDLLRSILEADEYADYIMDRRLMCLQLGMNLPPRLGFGQFTEKYQGRNQYNGTTVRAYYYVRGYIPGTASDKIPPSKYRNPAFALKFAELMGEAAATDMIVGRRSSETKENLFDKQYEVIQIGSSGLPVSLKVTSQAGSFFNYNHPFELYVAPYANVIRRRMKYFTDPEAVIDAYVGAFEKKIVETQKKYRSRRKAFDELFVHRPFDVAGSGAYRWAKTLERLDRCNSASVAAALRLAIEMK